MSRYLEEVRAKISAAEKILGIFKYSDERFKTRQKRLATLLNLNLALFNLLYPLNLVTHARGSLTRQIQLSIQWLSVGTLSLFYVLMVLNHDLYTSCIKWCETQHVKARKKKPMSACFEKCALEATRICKLLVWEMPVVVLGMCAVQMVVQSLIVGRFEPLFPVYLPFISSSHLLGRVLSTVNQWIACVTLLTPLSISFGTVFVTVKYAIGLKDSMKIALSKLPEDFVETTKQVVEMHCDLIETLRKVVRLMKIPILAFESASYGLLLLIWVTICFDPASFMIAVAASGEFVVYLGICWMNENLIAAFEDLREFLCELDWLRFTPKQCKVLLMVLMQRPHTLQAGPFHEISYHNFGVMVERAYKSCIVINKLINKT